MTQHVYRATEEQEHVTDGPECWCRPVHLCSECKVRWPCIHGSTRDEIIVHREAS